MNYAILEEGIIVNTIVVDDEEYARSIGAFPLKEEQGIGDIYEAPNIQEPEHLETDSVVDRLLNSFIQ